MKIIVAIVICLLVAIGNYAAAAGLFAYVVISLLEEIADK